MIECEQADRPTGPHRSCPCQRALQRLIGCLVGPPGASDPACELIMEPNSCCDAPINKNHFTLIFPPLLASVLLCLPTDCALCRPRPPPPSPPPHIPALRSCFKLLTLKTKHNHLIDYCCKSDGSPH